MNASIANATPAVAELEFEPGQPTLASGVSATPAEPTDAKKPPPRVEDFALHTSTMGAYRYELVHCEGYRDPMLRIVSLRAGKMPLSITWSPPSARQLLAAVQRYVERIGPSPRRPDETAEPTRHGKVDPSKLVPR